MKTVTDIAIQIVNWHTKTYLADCLRSLVSDLKKAPFSYTIAVLDNNSGDDLLDLQAEYSLRYPVAFYFHNQNSGFGGGHNILAKKTRAKYLLLLNPDILFIEPHTVTRLFRHSIVNPQIQVIGPRLVGADKKAQFWDHGELHGMIARLALSIGRSYWKIRRKPIDAAWVSGAVLLIRKAAFVQLGGFDEQFFLYKEDEDLCWRVRDVGGIIRYDPTITVLHHGSVVAKKEIFMQKAHDYFLHKHFGHKRSFFLIKRCNAIISALFL